MRVQHGEPGRLLRALIVAAGVIDIRIAIIAIISRTGIDIANASRAGHASVNVSCI